MKHECSKGNKSVQIDALHYLSIVIYYKVHIQSISLNVTGWILSLLINAPVYLARFSKFVVILWSHVLFFIVPMYKQQ